MKAWVNPNIKKEKLPEIFRLSFAGISGARLARYLSIRDLAMLCLLWLYVRVRGFSDEDISNRTYHPPRL